MKRFYCLLALMIFCGCDQKVELIGRKDLDTEENKLVKMACSDMGMRKGSGEFYNASQSTNGGQEVTFYVSCEGSNP